MNPLAHLIAKCVARQNGEYCVLLDKVVNTISEPRPTTVALGALYKSETTRGPTGREATSTPTQTPLTQNPNPPHKAIGCHPSYKQGEMCKQFHPVKRDSVPLP